MTFPTPPGKRDGHPEPGTGAQSLGAWAAGLPRQQAPERPAPATSLSPAPAVPPRRRAGVIDRDSAPDFPIADYARTSGPDDDRTGRMPGLGDPPPPPLPPVPGAPVPGSPVPGSPVPPVPGSPAGAPGPGAPVPPRPPGTWSRLQRRTDVPPDDEATVAQPAVGPPLVAPPEDEPGAGPDETARHEALWDDPQGEPHEDEHTGGLEVLVDDGGHRRGRRGRRAAGHDDHDDLGGEEAGPRRRRRPLAVVLSLIVLAALVAGIVVGSKAILGLVNPTDEDYTGTGTGTVQVRVADGDTLSDIGRSLADAGVVASVGPFVEAAEGVPAAMGIQPGVYGMRLRMSGSAALDLLLDPASRLFSRVTIPEGFTVQRVLERLAEETDTPIEELTRVAADPAALGLPPSANGLLEGWLFPATYEFEPQATPEQMLQQMIGRTVQTLDSLGVAEDQQLTVLTKASLVQAEAALPEDMGKVAQVLENRLADGMALQLDSTVNYASGKDGITTTAQDRANPSPYNTYYAPGLPPGAIGNPGEDAINAVLTPTPGPWVYFVTVDPDTGETRFAVTGEEHAENVALFQQWLRENPG